MNVAQVVKRLKMIKKADVQRELILEAWTSCDIFFQGLAMSMDPDTKVVLDKIVEMSPGTPEEPPFEFNEFVVLFDTVTQIDCDPKAARELTIDAAMRCDTAVWNSFYRRILLKKLQLDLPMDVITQTLAELTGLQKVL